MHTEEKGSVNMGKHDIGTPINETLEQHYKERIKRLEEEGHELVKENQELGHRNSILEGFIAELRDENERLARALGRVVAGV